MPHLLIIDDDSQELVKIRIGEIDPAKATVAILDALNKLKPARKTQSDAGKKKAAAEPEVV